MVTGHYYSIYNDVFSKANKIFIQEKNLFNKYLVRKHFPEYRYCKMIAKTEMGLEWLRC